MVSGVDGEDDGQLAIVMARTMVGRRKAVGMEEKRVIMADSKVGLGKRMASSWILERRPAMSQNEKDESGLEQGK